MTVGVASRCGQCALCGLFNFHSPPSRLVAAVLFMLALLVSSHATFWEPQSRNDDGLNSGAESGEKSISADVPP